MTYTYDPKLRSLLEEIALKLKVDLKSGVYAGLSGPTYETPAEIQMLKILGADMVGMSTVPEAIVANHQGIKILGISCITNLAAGLSQQKLHHGEIKEQALKVMKSFTNLIEEAVPYL
jgi:purine-nucleoside phosphorylase